MPKVYVNGQYITLTDEEYQKQYPETDKLENSIYAVDRVQQLAAGLSTATTIAQIRSVAKQILDETGGGDTE